MSYGGQSWQGFDMRAGIRQGCPLSPLLFATVLDPFLRLVQLRLPSATVRVYVDDIAITIREVATDLPILQNLFSDLARVARLDLSLPKTVCIPLWVEHLDRAAHRIHSACPAWSRMAVQRAGKYLGFHIGPEKGDSLWRDAGA